MNEIADFTIHSNLNLIECCPHNKTLADNKNLADNKIPINTIRHLLLDTILPFYLSLKDELLILHGSLVRKNNISIAFIGKSGSGKSSIASYLSKNGWQVMSDDVVILRNNIAIPSYQGTRLWPTMVNAICGETKTEKVSHLNDKRRVTLNFSNKECKLAALFSLEEAKNKKELFLKITSSSFILDCVDEKALTTHFNSISKLNKDIAIDFLNYSRDQEGLNLALKTANSYCS